jgi:hypothetical protein
MPFPTTGSNTELQAVNQILASVGQAPVNTLTTEEVLVVNEVSRFTGFLDSTNLLSNTDGIPVGTYVSGIGVSSNTSIAAAETVFTTTGSITGNVLTSPSPYIPKNTFISGTGISNVLVESGPTPSGGNYTYVVTAPNAASTTLTLDPVLYKYTTNISQTVGTADGFIDLTRAIVTQKVETQTNPDVAIAYNTLLEVSREVQAEGWTFNKEYNYPITPDSNDEVIIPNNVLQMDLNQEYTQNMNRSSVNRDGKLYDRTNHTLKWTDETLYVDVIWERSFNSIPTPVRAFIIARAAAIVSSRIVGDPNQYQMLQQKEAFARAMAMEYETSQGDYTFFGSPQGENFYRSYQPYHSLYR